VVVAGALVSELATGGQSRKLTAETYLGGGGRTNGELVTIGTDMEDRLNELRDRRQ
jgi:hypothetical protein